ncbi:MAG: hypothetical protein L0Y77_11190 [Chlorobi bacterium]|nr:hypothetical protein [Chlorobiota bacterium]
MKIFYELKLFENGFEELDRLLHYLRNHKEIPKTHHKSVKGFARRYKILLKAKADASQKNIDTLKMETDLNRYDWFKEKLSEFA